MMITFHVNGQQIGSLPSGDEVLSQLATCKEVVEVRNSQGETLGRFIAGKEPLVPWDPTLTAEELHRRAKAPGGMKLADFWKKMGVS